MAHFVACLAWPHEDIQEVLMNIIKIFLVGFMFIMMLFFGQHFAFALEIEGNFFMLGNPCTDLTERCG